MRLFELTDANPLDIRIVAVMSQITSDLVKNPGRKWTVEQLLDYLRKQDINLGCEMDQGETLRTLSQKPPLDKFIANIQGDDVIFVGQSGGAAGFDGADKQKDTVKAMASRALTR